MRKFAAPRRLLGASIVSALAFILSGCGGMIQNMSVRDRNAPMGAARATVRLDSTRRTGPGIEAGFEGYHAKGTQTLDTWETLTFPDGTSVTGPQSVHHDARLSQYHVAYNHRFGIWRSLELEPFVGIAHVNLKIKSTPAGGTTVTSIEEGHSAVTWGITPRWRVNDWLAGEVRVSALSGRFSVTGLATEAAVVLNPSRNVALRLGWARRTHEFEDRGVYPSTNITLESYGPLATLQFDF